MRLFAKQVIIDTAGMLGIKAENVMDNPSINPILLNPKRIELNYDDEILTRSFRRMSKFVTPGSNETHITYRNRIYKNELTVNAVFKSDDESWLSSFVKKFILTIPSKTADQDNNLVTIEVVQAERDGFTTDIVEVEKSIENELEITFTGMICEDETWPLIKNFNINDGISYEK